MLEISFLSKSESKPKSPKTSTSSAILHSMNWKIFFLYSLYYDDPISIATQLIYTFYFKSKSNRQKNNLSLSVSFKLGVTSTPFLGSQTNQDRLMVKCNLILIIQPNDFQFDLRTRGYHFERDGNLPRLVSIVITLFYVSFNESKGWPHKCILLATRHGKTPKDLK